MATETDAKTRKTKLRPVILMMRGDHQMNEAKLSSAVGGRETRPMTEEEIQALFHSPAGFLGPIGLEPAKTFDDSDRPILIVDDALKGRKNLISGANQEDYHLKNVTPEVDFHPTAYAELRTVTAGEACPSCDAPLRIDTAVEIGHIFKLGYKYSESMGARVLDRNGKEVMPIMAYLNQASAKQLKEDIANFINSTLHAEPVAVQ